MKVTTAMTKTIPMHIRLHENFYSMHKSRWLYKAHWLMQPKYIHRPTKMHVFGMKQTSLLGTLSRDQGDGLQGNNCMSLCGWLTLTKQVVCKEAANDNVAANDPETGSGWRQPLSTPVTRGRRETRVGHPTIAVTRCHPRSARDSPLV